MQPTPLAAILLLPLLGGASPPGSGPSPPPNVLILVADDLGVDNVGAYGEGADLPATPILDTLASQGILFRNAWAHPICSPSRAAIQTGRYPFRTGIGIGVDEGSPIGLPYEEVTIPEMLDAGGAGYSHAAFGKWHLANSTVGGSFGPNLAGYSHYVGVLGNLGPDPSAWFTWKEVRNGEVGIDTGYLTTDTVDEAIDWIQSAPQPWLCYVAFHAPHQPFHAPPASLHSVDLSGAGPPDVDQRPYYKAMVEAMDREIGRLFTTIQIDFDRTYVFFLGDNGTPQSASVPPFLPTHAKGTVYQGGVRVPLIAAGPSVATPGGECHALVDSTDLFAAVAEIAGVPASPEGTDPVPPPREAELFGGHHAAPRSAEHVLDSRSLLPYLADPGLPSMREWVFAQSFDPNGMPFVDRRQHTIRGERFKLSVEVRMPGVEDRYLFDLEQDPFELVNLLEEPGGPTGAAARWLGRLESWSSELIAGE